MTQKILIVDDDLNLLKGILRSLPEDLQVETAEGGAQALEKLKNEQFAVIVSDMRMPGMNGIQFLSEVCKASPDSIRVMLTGNLDQETAIRALNETNVFRFLTKPCPPERFLQTLREAVQAFRDAYIERELLEKTLGGCIKVFAELLSLTQPESFKHAQKIRQNFNILLKAHGFADAWKIEFAILLADLGLITIPTGTVRKMQLNAGLLEAEKRLLRNVPQVSHDLIANIPRLEAVAKIILYNCKNFDGSGFPENEVREKEIPFGSRLIRILTDMEKLQKESVSPRGALARMKRDIGYYDNDLLLLIEATLCGDREAKVLSELSIIDVDKLEVGQILVENLCDNNGILIAPAERMITPTLIKQLQHLNALRGEFSKVHVRNAEVIPK